MCNPARQRMRGDAVGQAVRTVCPQGAVRSPPTVDQGQRSGGSDVFRPQPVAVNPARTRARPRSSRKRSGRSDVVRRAEPGTRRTHRSRRSVAAAKPARAGGLRAADLGSSGGLQCVGHGTRRLAFRLGRTWHLTQRSECSIPGRAVMNPAGNVHTCLSGFHSDCDREAGARRAGRRDESGNAASRPLRNRHANSSDGIDRAGCTTSNAAVRPSLSRFLPPFRVERMDGMPGTHIAEISGASPPSLAHQFKRRLWWNIWRTFQCAIFRVPSWRFGLSCSQW
jgi:hypothetical protein